MRGRRALLSFAALCAVVAAVGEIQSLAVRPADPLPARCANADRPDAALFLVGDAGAPRATEPLLEALRDEARERVDALGAGRVAIAFLGDNVYPAGLRAADHPGRAADERRLDAQLDIARKSGARGVFVPGNHDWDDQRAGGWDAIKRQTRYVAARGAVVLPPDGCPGPAVLALGDRLSLVALDTQWWMHDYAKPSDAAAGCAATDLPAIESAIAGALRDAGDRHAIVLAHHPLATGGPHGARFGWSEHLFPIREVDRRGWIPLPVIGSIWPVLRMLGRAGQDLPHASYRALGASLERAFAAERPLALAAGHDHSLQLLRAGPARFQIVSGAGSPANVTWAHPVEGSLFAAATPGWVRLDAYADGAVELAVRGGAERGTASDLHRACLAP